jgi:ABC-2 type transport system ATP-binding protein/lipopolysaccharide transport system ATP-binding protein
MASICLRNVSVSFPIYDVSSRSLKKRLLGSTGGIIKGGLGKQDVSVVQALDDVSTSFEHGDRVGSIGHHGSGKTTLLRVLAGIYEPNSGTVDIRGHVAPMFDLGLGMDPESSGFENIFLRGLYLGLKPAQIRARIDKIAEFTELGDFLELPIRTYSDGMRMRLAFAVSTSIDPDILLVDEGIGTGDAAFQGKAKKRLAEFAERAAIIVLASHAQVFLKQVCNKAMLMRQGRIVLFDETEKVLEVYRKAAAGQGGAPVRA